MKLWLISQDVNDDYDTYDSAVVAAESEAEAKMIHPGTGEDITPGQYSAWAGSPDNVRCEYLGEAKEGTPKSVICASFNAG